MKTKKMLFSLIIFFYSGFAFAQHPNFTVVFNSGIPPEGLTIVDGGVNDLSPQTNQIIYNSTIGTMSVTGTSWCTFSPTVYAIGCHDLTFINHGAAQTTFTMQIRPPDYTMGATSWWIYYSGNAYDTNGPGGYTNIPYHSFKGAFLKGGIWDTVGHLEGAPYINQPFGMWFLHDQSPCNWTIDGLVGIYSFSLGPGDVIALPKSIEFKIGISDYVPTLSQWGLIILGIMLLGAGVLFIIKRKRILA